MSMLIELSQLMRTLPPPALFNLSKISTRLSDTGLCALLGICLGLTMVLQPADGVGIDWLDLTNFRRRRNWFCGELLFRLWWLQCIADFVLHGLSHSLILYNFQFPFPFQYSIHTGHDPRAISSYDVIINEDYFADSRLSTLP